MKDEEDDKLPVGVYIIQKGLFSHVDQSLARILGFQSPRDLIGKSIWDIIHPDDRKLVKLEIREGADEAAADRPVIRVVRNDKTVLWVHMGGSTTTYQGGPANKGYLIDITPFKKAERYLKYHLANSKSIIEQIEDGVSEVDLQGNGTFGNLANRKMLGIDTEDVEALGRNFRSYMDEETAEKVFRAFHEVYRTGIPGKNIVYDIIRKDGSRRTVEASVSLIRDEDGKVTGFRAVNRDITERQKAEKELAEHRVQLEAIFRSVKDAIMTLDAEQRVILANQEIENCCGIAAKDITGMTFPQSLGRCSRACNEVIRRTLERNETVKEYRIECGHAERRQQLVSLTSSPLMDQEGRPTGALLVIRDMTLLRDLERELRERHCFQSMIGKSKKMQEIYSLLEDLSNLETTVLITGESGTGKELVARALHYSGQRAFHPFVTVNCSALTESLLESELFGHVRGAFTGAIHDKQGRFQAADGGTILLDEIGDISPLIQLKLLRVLQEKVFERVGESTPQKVDVRIIASTNKDLKEKVKRGEFREDLYYRLKVVDVSLPPLRERLDDLPLLVDHFCDMFNKRFKKEIEGISNEVLNTFMSYLWPGNIRELEHVIEHAFVLCRGRVITLEHIPAEVRQSGPPEKLLRQRNYIKEKVSAGDIAKALKETKGNKARAARLLGISRPTLYRKHK
ncbi:MAG: PAS domain S-box protein [Deltaproteobacteria bacterium]|nr:PAS domain S-box protein [Deltaproteobacteria bacterium]